MAGPEAINRNIPLVRGSTVLILRTLFESQVPLKKPDTGFVHNKPILLNAQAAEARASIASMTPLKQGREEVDAAVGKLMTDAEKRPAAKLFFEENATHESKIQKLEEERTALDTQFEKIKQLQTEFQKKIAAIHEQGKTVSSDPTLKSELTSMAKEIMDYRSKVKKFNETHATIHMALEDTAKKITLSGVRVEVVPRAITHERNLGG